MRVTSSLAIVGAVACGIGFGFGCGSNVGESAFDGGNKAHDDAIDASTDNATPMLGMLGAEASAANLVVTPANPTLDVNAAGVTQLFEARVNGQGSPVPAKWTLDAAGIGTIDANGLFTATGALGGPVHVTAIAGSLQAETTLTVHLHLAENAGNVADGTKASLEAGGATDPTFGWLYPYDQTVFPRDLPSPSMQFTGTSFDAAFVHVTFANLDYQGFFSASTPPRIQLPVATWKAITGSATGSDSIKVEVTKIAGGKVTGPITHTWKIAQGNLRGSIYYNSYNSTLAGNTGAVLRMRPGQTPTVVIPSNPNNECHVCHSVSANGTTLIASNEQPVATTGFVPTDGVYDLTSNGAKLHDAPNRTWDFGALSPDGSKFLRFGVVPWANAANPAAPQPWLPNVRGLGQSGDLPSALFDPKTGAAIPAAGLDGQKLHMMMPVFSSDGKHVAFNHYDSGKGATIAVMDFDNPTNTFTNLRDVATLPTGTFAGWPTFTPDDAYVLFAGGTDAEYDTMSDNASIVPNPKSDLYVAHVASGTIAKTDALNGILAGANYLPFADDAQLNFEPTILPVASGGYYWVVFTSRREYGNTVNGSPWTGPAGAPSPRKKLWVAAIDIDAMGSPATAAKDITHPAFYLDGQELTAGNMRAFWALDPCQQNGTTCDTGDECCAGFCRQSTDADGGTGFTCVAPSGCAHESEKCATAADCCDVSTGVECINGFCAMPTPK